MTLAVDPCHCVTCGQGMPGRPWHADWCHELTLLAVGDASADLADGSGRGRPSPAATAGTNLSDRGAP